LEAHSWFGEYECLHEEKSEFTYTAVGPDSHHEVDASTNPARSMLGSALNRDLNKSAEKPKKDESHNRVRCMCVHEEAFAECCSLWPKAKAIFLKRSI
jgi:hypothetical protein